MSCTTRARYNVSCDVMCMIPCRHAPTPNVSSPSVIWCHHTHAVTQMSSHTCHHTHVITNMSSHACHHKHVNHKHAPHICHRKHITTHMPSCKPLCEWMTVLLCIVRLTAVRMVLKAVLATRRCISSSSSSAGYWEVAEKHTPKEPEV